MITLALRAIHDSLNYVVGSDCLPFRTEWSNGISEPHVWKAPHVIDKVYRTTNLVNQVQLSIDAGL